jgi:RNA binding exosome subunit
MHEIIKKFADEATDHALEQNRAEDSYGNPVNKLKYKNDRDAKFAELIIEECINRATEFGVLSAEIREYLSELLE